MTPVNLPGRAPDAIVTLGKPAVSGVLRIPFTARIDPRLRAPRVRGWCTAVVCVLLWAASTLPAAAETEPGAESAVAADCPRPQRVDDQDWEGQRQWEAIEAEGLVLGTMSIDVRDVYVGPDLPWYGRLANTLHINTAPSAVEALLTVEPGEAVAADRIYEAERALRSEPFLVSAQIVPVRCSEGRVDTEVRVRDAWTLQVGAGFGTAGGETTSSFRFRDQNFLGTGKTVQFGWDRDRDGTSRDLGYRDPSVLGSPWTLELERQQSTDGHGNFAAVAYPFRRSDQALGFSAEADDSRGDLKFEQGGDTAYEARLDRQRANIELRQLVNLGPTAGWRLGAGWRRQYHVYGELDEEEPELRPPPELRDRRMQGPYLVLERFHDRQRTFRNLRRIGVAEDYSTGLDVRMVGGLFRDDVAAPDPWFFEVDLGYGREVGARNLLLGQLSLAGRYASRGDDQPRTVNLEFDYYHRTSDRNTVVTHVELDWQRNPDPENELYLGGFDGLLAYPQRFRVGDRRRLLHLENRYTSDRILFDTIQVGYTGFVEAGRIRGLDGEWSRTLADVGAGLRLGSLRSSFGSVTYVTVAVPLVDVGNHNDYEVVIGSTVSF